MRAHWIRFAKLRCNLCVLKFERSTYLSNYKAIGLRLLLFEVNQKLNIQFYVDRNVNDPLVTSSYRRSTTQIGTKILFNLARLHKKKLATWYSDESRFDT